MKGILGCKRNTLARCGMNKTEKTGIVLISVLLLVVTLSACEGPWAMIVALGYWVIGAALFIFGGD